MINEADPDISRSMTRRATLLASCLVAALVLLGLQSWGIAVGRIEQRVVAAVERETGLVVTGFQRAEIALLPLPRVSLSQVAFKQPDGGVLSGSALRMRARARLLPLLVGRLAFDRIDLIEPTIDVAVAGGEDGLVDWLSPPLAYVERLKVQSRIVIAGGSVFMRAEGAIRTILRDVNLTIDERKEGEPIVLAGSVNWRGAATRLALQWPVAGERAKLALSAEAPLISLQFDGWRSGLHEPVVNGRLSLQTKSLPELLGWFGDRPRLAAALGAVKLSADAEIKSGEASLSGASVALDTEVLEGAIKLADAGGRLALSGTLAGAALDLAKLHGRLGALPPGPLDFDGWTAHDVDLRISVDAARLDGARLDDVATYLLVKKGRFEAGLLRAGAYGGSAKGRLLAVAAPAGVDVKLQAGFDRINLGKAAADVPDLARLTGIAGGQLALDGLGASYEEIVASLSGKAGATARQGELGGFAFADLLRRLERNPGLVLRDWRQGKTSFDSASINLSVANGIAMVTDGQMSGPAYRLTLAGQAALPSRWLDLGILLTPFSGSPRIPFTWRGPFDAPAFELDTDGLARGATAFPTQLLR
jgi:uncharacterized protein involved in outer membrane biogenesis